MRIIIQRESRRKLKPWTTSPKKADGTTEKEHYKIAITTPEGGRFQNRSSEWGAMGEIMDAMRKAGDNGKRKLYISVTIEDDGPINEAEAPAGKSGGCSDSSQDATDLIRALRAMADMSYSYFD